jgi:hypothetical protein
MFPYPKTAGLKIPVFIMPACGFMELAHGTRLRAQG